MQLVMATPLKLISVNTYTAITPAKPADHHYVTRSKTSIHVPYSYVV